MGLIWIPVSDVFEEQASIPNAAASKAIASTQRTGGKPGKDRLFPPRRPAMRRPSSN
jgi:hypothetical protein